MYVRLLMYMHTLISLYLVSYQEDPHRNLYRNCVVSAYYHPYFA